MSLLAYLRNNSHHYNIQNSAPAILSATTTPLACGACNSYGGAAAVFSQSHSSVPHRHDHRGLRPIARVLHQQDAAPTSTTIPSRLSSSHQPGSHSVDQARDNNKLSIPQMTDDSRHGARGPYEQLHDAAAAGPPDTEGDISPTTRLPSIQNLLTTASTTSSGVKSTASPAGNPAPMYINPSGSATSIGTEGLTRTSISSSTSSQSTSSATARMSPAMTTTSTSATTTPTPQSGFLDSGSMPAQQVPHMMTSASVTAAPTMAAAAALQMPTSVYPPPQQQHFIYPGPPPPPPPPPPAAAAAAMSGPQIHPPPLPQYMAAPVAPQPYYMPTAPSPVHGTAYPPAANPYAGLQLHPHPGLAQPYAPMRPVALGPGIPPPAPIGGPAGPSIPHGVQTPHLAPLKPKRKRATQQQVNRLNEVFQQTFFPSTEQRLELSRELGMTPRTVQIWFQNRRQGWRAESRRSTGPQTERSLQDISPSASASGSRRLPGEGAETEYDLEEE
ncbi:hypothetical protein V1525DRAFT_406512 [Lipomyces kononenkoae]|uniref:Uncharacterized protein n=1 Tax=Lipomyces kononenkoae TaxID=34357 RepID=A0ACC3T0N1_LIPKO